MYDKGIPTYTKKSCAFLSKYIGAFHSHRDMIVKFSIDIPGFLISNFRQSAEKPSLRSNPYQLRIRYVGIDDG